MLQNKSKKRTRMNSASDDELDCEEGNMLPFYFPCIGFFNIITHNKEEEFTDSLLE